MLPRNLTICLVFALAQLSCKGKSSTVSISVKAKSAEGFPVAGADITLNQEIIGQTNGFGTFQSKVELPADQRYKIALTKEDDKYYFAPHVETFKTEKGEDRNLAIDATMFTVPKPKLTKKNTDLVKAAEKPTSAENDPAKVKDIEPMPLLPLITSASIKPLAESNIKGATAEILTVHIYAGRFPLDKVLVTFISSDGREVTCQSNDRGRCVLEAGFTLPTDGMFLVQKQGYKTVSLKAEARANSNHRINMEAGSSLDIRAKIVGPFSSKSADKVLVRIKPPKQAASTVQTDSNGLATIPIEAKYPIELDLTHATTGHTQKRIIEDSNSLIVDVKFSDASVTGWSQWLRYPIHLSQAALAESGLVDLERLDSTLDQRHKASEQSLNPAEFRTLAPDAVALLPVINKDDKGLRLGLLAIDQKGKITESMFTTLPLSSVTEEQWLAAYDTVVKNLFAKLPWPGTVAAVKNRELEIALNTEFIDKSDRISVETANGPMSASITKITRKGVRVTLDAASHMTARDLLNLIGAKAQKIVHESSTKTSADLVDLSNLVSIRTEHRARRLAKKYLAENNPDEAVKILIDSLDEKKPSIDDLELALSIDNARGNTQGVLTTLKKLGTTAIKTGRLELIPIIETNIQLVQVENLPVINGDTNIARRFEEIESKAKELKNEIASDSEQTPQAIALAYIILTAQQKAAESKDDLMKLATMSEAWGSFEKNLDSSADTPQKTWRDYAARQKDRSSLGSTRENTSL